LFQRRNADGLDDRVHDRRVRIVEQRHGWLSNDCHGGIVRQLKRGRAFSVSEVNLHVSGHFLRAATVLETQIILYGILPKATQFLKLRGSRRERQGASRRFFPNEPGASASHPSLKN
jgi:hypothetical protein